MKELLHINVLRFRGGLVLKAHRLCVSLNSRLESNKEEEERTLQRRLPGLVRQALRRCELPMRCPQLLPPILTA